MLVTLIITFKYLSGFASILIKVHWGEQFGFVPLPSTLEVVLGVFSLDCDNMSYPHLGNLQRGEQIDFEKLFQKHNMTIPFPSSILTCLLTRIRFT